MKTTENPPREEKTGYRNDTERHRDLQNFVRDRANPDGGWLTDAERERISKDLGNPPPIQKKTIDRPSKEELRRRYDRGV